MKVLISSYTCCPGKGSEQGMGWNWIVSLAKYCEVYVISEGEYRSQVEAWLHENGNLNENEDENENCVAKRMHFYWNPVDEETRRMCWNQGDWRFYPRYRKWQKRTAEIARKIIEDNENETFGTKTKNKNKNENDNHNLNENETFGTKTKNINYNLNDNENFANTKTKNKNETFGTKTKNKNEKYNYNDNYNENESKRHGIDVLHQLNMIGFREPGYLYKVSKETGIPLVWGPIGGLKMFPLKYSFSSAFTSWDVIKMLLFNGLKNTINKLQIKYDSRVAKALKQSSVLISSIPDSYNAIKKYHGLESVIIPETGCFPKKQNDDCPNRFHGETLTVLWIGKFDFRKRLDIALKAIAAIGKRDVVLKVFGSGNPTQVDEAKSLVAELSIDNQIKFMGNCPNDVVNKEMQVADLFLFTSVSEDTSTVVLEAVSNGLPVLCFDICGMSAVIDETVGRKVKITNPEQSVKDFAREIYYLYNNREELESLSSACRQRAEELSWDRKAKEVVEMYERVSV